MAEKTVTFTVNATPEIATILITYSGVVQEYEWTEKTISSGQFVRVLPGAKIHYKITAPGYYTIEDDVVVTSDLELEFSLNPITVSEYLYTLKSNPSDAVIKLYKINDDETTTLLTQKVGAVQVILPRYTRLKYTIHSDETTIIEYAEYVIMPRASSAYVDQTIKYIGETTTTYTQNSYYKCQLNADGYTYSWVIDSSADPSPQQKYATNEGTLVLTEARVDTIDLQEFGCWVKLIVRPHPENATVTFSYTKTSTAEVTPIIVNNNVEHSIYYSPTQVTLISYNSTLSGYSAYKNTANSWTSPDIPTSNQIIDAYFKYDIPSAVLLNTSTPGTYTVNIPESYPGIYIKQIYLVGAGGGGAVWWYHKARKGHTDYSHSGIGGGAAGAFLQGSSIHSSMSGTYYITVGSGGNIYRVNADWAGGSGTAGSGSLIIKDNQTLCIANGGAGGVTGGTSLGGSYEVNSSDLSLVGVKGSNGVGHTYNESSESGRYEKINQVGATSAYPPYGNGGQSGCSNQSTEKGQNGYAYFEVASLS